MAVAPVPTTRSLVSRLVGGGVVPGPMTGCGLHVGGVRHRGRIGGGDRAGCARRRAVVEPVVEPVVDGRRRGARPTRAENEAGHGTDGKNVVDARRADYPPTAKRCGSHARWAVAGRWAVDASRIYSVGDARRRAARAVPRALFDYIDGGADDEVTLDENRAGLLARSTFRPRMANATGDPQVSTTLLGTALALPVLLAPCGLVRFMHPDGAPGVARAAAAVGTVSVLSTVAGSSLEDVRDLRAGTEMVPAVLAGWTEADRGARGTGPGGGLRRAGRHPRHARSRTSRTRRPPRGHPAVPVRATARAAVWPRRSRSDPRWLTGMARPLSRPDRPRAGPPRPAAPASPTARLVAMGASPFSWDDVTAIRRQWTGPLSGQGSADRRRRPSRRRGRLRRRHRVEPRRPPARRCPGHDAGAPLDRRRTSVPRLRSCSTAASDGEATS